MAFISETLNITVFAYRTFGERLINGGSFQNHPTLAVYSFRVYDNVNGIKAHFFE